MRHITFFDLLSMDGEMGPVKHLTAETYHELRADHYLFVFYTREGGGMGSELQILESLHKRILRLENIKTSP